MSSLEEIMECRECGRRLPHGKSRCIYCGAVTVPTADAPAGRTGMIEGGYGADVEIPVEERTIFCMDEGSGSETDFLAGSDFDTVPGFGTGQRDTARHVGIEQSRKRKPGSRVLQVLIFFASALIMGAVVWLMR